MRIVMLILLFVGAGARQSTAQDASPAEASSTLIALEALWNQALQANDINALNRILDDGFVIVDSSGRLLTKGERLAQVRTSQGMQFKLESVAVHLHGDTAVVTGVYQTKSALPGKRSERFVDTWRYKNGSWVSIARLLTPIGP
jgi:ketosteroid isomerase-like protein